MAGKLSVTLENRLDEIQRVTTALEEFAEHVGLAGDVTFQIVLSIEEIFTNIVSYGYEDDSTHEVNVTVEADSNQIQIEIIDDAKAFNPLEMETKENPESLDEMSIGGQGWVLIRTYMDDLSYEYRDGQNRLKLVKRLN